MKSGKKKMGWMMGFGGFSLLTILSGGSGSSMVGSKGGEMVLTQNSPAGTERTHLDLRAVSFKKGPSIRPVRIYRVSTVVPWPRGLAWYGDRLIVLARGRHRRAGGLDPRIQDQAGTLFLLDPDLGEEVLPSSSPPLVGPDEPVSKPPSKTNGVIFARPQSPTFHLYDPSIAPAEAHEIDRPYCSLVHDPASQSFFICGFSGIDLPGSKFRKNATDSILRFDLRNHLWSVVESHASQKVPVSALSKVVPNTFFPHHDPKTQAPPHGWLNGPDALCIGGNSLFAAAKDNHLVVSYDLRALRKNPLAAAPPSRVILGPKQRILVGKELRVIPVLGPSALTVYKGYLYVGYRTTSVVVRYPLDQAGNLQRGKPGELIAVFEPYDPKTRRSANLIDMAFNTKGELFVSCSKEGRIWNIGKPDPSRVFQGNDQLKTLPTSAPPYADLRILLGKKTACGNILFDQKDRLFLCAGNYDTPSRKLAGVIYRIDPR